MIRSPRRTVLLLVVALISLGPLGPGRGVEAQLAPMNRMDHGPFVSSTITLDPFSPRGIIVQKGIAVKVDGEATMVFDTDLLRVVGAWTGGMLHWRPARDSLQEWPTPDGHLHFVNPEKAGWSTNGDLTDPRGGSSTLNNARRYGPLPGNRRYEGLHVRGDDVVFSMTVGDATVREKFGFQRVGDDPIFTRTINVSPTSQKLTLLVISAPVGQASRLEETAVSDGAGHVAIHSGGEARLIGYRGLPKDVQWSLEAGQLSVSLPALAGDLRFQLAIGPIRPAADVTAMKALLQTDAGSLDLAPYLEPGPARYQALETRAAIASSEHGPFVVDTFVLPHENPWNSHLRLSAVDFLPDGRAAVVSMSGDVWLVDGIGEAPGTLRWQRFATGLNQPLGLVVVNGTIYVNGRDQITRLHDANKDGYADRYENFNNAVMTGTNFHAFNLNLEVDAQGRFLWAKSTPWPTGNPGELSDAAQIPPHDGVLFRLSPDGRELEIIATGLRNPNGLSVGPKGEIYVSDNEGNWVPTSKVTRIVEGAFHGFVPSAHRASLIGGWAATDDWVKPLVWTPHAGPGSDNSPSQARVIDSPAWPQELQGDLLLASYGRGTLSLLLMEEVDGQPQAAHMTLPLQFRSGLQQMRFHRDGHLYVVGMTNWSSTSYGGDRGGFHRVRYTEGKPLHLPVALHTKAGGLELRFATPLDRASATNPANYKLSKWTYTWNSSYGSKQFFSLDEPGQAGPDPVTVQSATLSADGRTLLLEIPSLRPGPIPRIPLTGKLPHQIEASIGMLMQIDYGIRAADGAELKHLITKTIHRVPGNPSTTSLRLETNPAPNPASADAHTPGGHARSGLLATKSDTAAMDLEPAAPRDRGRVVVVRSKGLDLSYDPAEISARAGETLTIRYENAGEMTHNIVVVKSERDVPLIGEAAFQAAYTNNWIPRGAEYAARMIAYTPLAAAKETVEVTFTVPPPGVYPFICTYASHWTVMRGKLIVGPSQRLDWGPELLEKPQQWYGSAEARAIADSVIQYQSPQGGWPKSTDLATPPRSAKDVPQPGDGRANTIDNGATTTPMRFLALVADATGEAKYRAAFERGLDYLFAAQYPNGGWPQFYPLREGYYSRITFNDDAMINVLTLLRDAGNGEAPYGFVDPARRKQASAAVARGTNVILRAQIKQDGRHTAWCAQHDEKTLEPARARAYEPPSLSGAETVGIVRFLMSVEKPTPAIAASVEGAVQWLRSVAMSGVRVERIARPDGRTERILVADPNAPPVWARFYELGTNRPLYLDRDSVYRYDFCEIGYERRSGYSYHGDWAASLLNEDYPRWRATYGLR